MKKFMILMAIAAAAASSVGCSQCQTFLRCFQGFRGAPCDACTTTPFSTGPVYAGSPVVSPGYGCNDCGSCYGGDTMGDAYGAVVADPYGGGINGMQFAPGMTYAPGIQGQAGCSSCTGGSTLQGGVTPDANIPVLPSSPSTGLTPTPATTPGPVPQNQQ